MHILDVYCPKCKHRMKYQYNGINMSRKRKTCVYCGKNFGVRQQIIC